MICAITAVLQLICMKTILGYILAVLLLWVVLKSLEVFLPLMGVFFDFMGLVLDNDFRWCLRVLCPEQRRGARLKRRQFLGAPHPPPSQLRNAHAVFARWRTR